MNKTGTILASRRFGKINETDEKWKCEVAGASPMKSLCPVQRGAGRAAREAEQEEWRAGLLSLLHSALELTPLSTRGAEAPAQESPQQQCPVQAAEGSKGPACLESSL